ncbi:hypothetical protein DIE04_17305 [Burkholderia sp. Bp8994]|nr:hypothetical protein DIE04_17305 [Burkholderia sp. Bp8994]
MPQPGPWQQRHERELVEQRGSKEANARLNRALRYWFRRDTWTPDEALPLLIGIDPGSLSHGDSHIRYLDGALVCIAAAMHAHGVEWPIESFDDFGKLEDLKAVPTLIHEMKFMWESGNHPPRTAPAYFIEWAQRKGFKVPWLASARHLNLIDFPENNESRATANDSAFDTTPARPTDAPQSAGAATSVAATSTAATKYIIKARRNVLDPLIDRAIETAESDDPNAVFPVLRKMALAEDGPFTGIVDGGKLDYTGDDNVQKSLTKEALAARLKRRRPVNK